MGIPGSMASSSLGLRLTLNPIEGIHLVLYPLLSLSIGRKGASALPSKDDLVLYHPLFLSRDQQNQPQQRLRGGDLVLYHRLARVPHPSFLPLTPFLHIGISPLKIPRILLTPGLLGQMLAGLLQDSLRQAFCLSPTRGSAMKYRPHTTHRFCNDSSSL